MSQHHLTVTSTTGARIQLIAGWDRPLRTFFMSLRDVRLPGPDSSEPDPENADELVRYDSLYERGGLRSLSAVEAKLAEMGIPFASGDEGQDEEPAAGPNPRLLPLLGTLLEEQDSNGEAGGRTCKNWDRAA